MSAKWLQSIAWESDSIRRIMSASDRQDRNAGRKSFVNPTQDCQSGGSGSDTTIPAEFHYQAPHPACTLPVTRSGERREGQACVSTGRSRLSPYPKKQTEKTKKQ